VKYEVTSYMKNSEDCREKAASTSRADQREQWLVLAEAWRALAESAERAFVTALRVATVNVASSRRRLDSPQPEVVEAKRPHPRQSRTSP
jgi:hypothetical protein